MVPALKTPRPKHALGGVLSMMRGEILRQAPSCGPSLYDPLSADKTGGAVRGQRLRRIVLCAELGFPLSWCASIGAWVVCRHVPLPVASPSLSRRMDRARPGQAPCLWHLSRPLPVAGPARPRRRRRFPPCQGVAGIAIHR